MPVGEFINAHLEAVITGLYVGGAALAGLLVMVWRRGIKDVKRDQKIEQLEREIHDLKDEVHTAIEESKQEHNYIKGRIDKTTEGLARIEGYLKGQKTPPKQ